MVRLWLATLRVQVVGRADAIPGAATVFAFWHGQQMGLLAARRGRRLTTLVSWSADGALQARVMSLLGVHPVRGSSSRGGAAGQRGLLRSVDAGSDAAVAVDGPRGPACRVKPGAAALARRTGAQLVPLASACSRARVLAGTWDGFELPLPFSRVVVAVGAPVDAALAARDPSVLAAAIERARSTAQAHVARSTARADPAGNASVEA